MRIVTVVAALALAVPGLAQEPESVRRKEALEHWQNGRTFMVTEKWDDAERELRIAVKLDPLLSEAHYDLGQTYMAGRRYPEAEKAYLAARQAFLDVAALRSSDQARGDQRIDELIEQLQESVRLVRGPVKTAQPEFTVLKLEERIRSLQDQKRRGASERVEAPAEVTMALGSAYFRQNKLEEARREWEEAVKVKPSFGEAHSNLAVVYMLTGKFEESKAEIKKAEKAGYKVSPKLKEDLEARIKGK